MLAAKPRTGSAPLLTFSGSAPSGSTTPLLTADYRTWGPLPSLSQDKLQLQHQQLATGQHQLRAATQCTGQATYSPPGPWATVAPANGAPLQLASIPLGHHLFAPQLQLQQRTDTTLSLSWKAQPKVYLYLLTLYGPGLPTQVYAPPGTDSTYTLTGLSPDTPYQLSILPFTLDDDCPSATLLAFNGQRFAYRGLTIGSTYRTLPAGNSCASRLAQLQAQADAGDLSCLYQAIEQWIGWDAWGQHTDTSLLARGLQHIAPPTDIAADYPHGYAIGSTYRQS
ncbi:MAG: fibronectin type III domain-containing protein, partial [Sphingobacteriia bacterium]